GATAGCGATDEPIRIVSAGLGSRGRPDPPVLPRGERAASAVARAISARRGVFFETAAEFVDCPVYDRRRLAAGHVVTGPAVIDQFDSTTLLHPGQQAEIDDLGFVLVQS